MELTVYDIIKGPVISDKAYKLNKVEGQLVLEVHLDATRPQIKSAIEKLFDVKIKSLRTHIVKYAVGGTMQRKRRAIPKVKKEKRAMVTLAEGYSLNLFEQAESAAASSESVKKQKTGKKSSSKVTRG
jgi:large subunit ribosomal protein L23